MHVKTTLLISVPSKINDTCKYSMLYIVLFIEYLLYTCICALFFPHTYFNENVPAIINDET